MPILEPLVINHIFINRLWRAAIASALEGYEYCRIFLNGVPYAAIKVQQTVFEIDAFVGDKINAPVVMQPCLHPGAHALWNDAAHWEPPYGVIFQV